MTNKIHLPTDHPNLRNVEAFLNSWSESFVLEKSSGDSYLFYTTRSHVQVEIIFFDSQQEAIEYGKKHLDPVSPFHRWSINGGFLYSITGKDEALVSDLAGHFAGQE